MSERAYRAAIPFTDSCGYVTHTDCFDAQREQGVGGCSKHGGNRAGRAVQDDGRTFEQAVWRAIQSYPGTIEIDNAQRFREHLWGRAVQEGPSALRLHDGLDVERLARVLENMDPAMVVYFAEGNWKGTPRKFAHDLIKAYRAASPLNEMER